MEINNGAEQEPTASCHHDRDDHDFCNHYALSLEKPDWHVRLDMDKELAVATRTRLLDMIATDKIPFTSYHMPFPAVGFNQSLLPKAFKSLIHVNAEGA